MLHTGHTARGLARHSLGVGVARGWRVVLLVGLLLSMVLTTLTDGRAAVDGYVDTDVLYLRSEPTTDAGVVAEMVSGEYVTVIDGPTDDGWYFLDYAGWQGWAFGEFLSIGGESGWASSSSASIGGTGDTVWVATDAINIRSRPDLDSVILGTEGQGVELSVVGDSTNGFFPVSYGSETGWAAGEYLSWSPVATGQERWIDVDRSSSTISLMIGQDSIATYVASMGIDNSEDGFYATALGTYYVFTKNQDLTWTDWAKGYITYWVGFDEERANGFHSWLLDEDGRFLEGGDGPTGGCVALEPTFAEAVYEFSTVGMRVEVHW